ncbi:hypothetical protein QL285_007815 [Trifolium repens]|nr:hypothetical protein QL285_007815 [Trifolium repens]
MQSSFPSNSSSRLWTSHSSSSTVAAATSGSFCVPPSKSSLSIVKSKISFSAEPSSSTIHSLSESMSSRVKSATFLAFFFLANLELVITNTTSFIVFCFNLFLLFVWI